jgi:hypothetical protein
VNLASLGADNVRTFGEYPVLAIEDRQLIAAENVDQPLRRTSWIGADAIS